jgi:hypothetical protein
MRFASLAATLLSASMKKTKTSMGAMSFSDNTKIEKNPLTR